MLESFLVLPILLGFCLSVCPFLSIVSNKLRSSTFGTEYLLVGPTRRDDLLMSTNKAGDLARGSTG